MSDGVSASIYMGVVFRADGEATELLEDFEGEFDNWVVAQMAPELHEMYNNYDDLTSKEKSYMWDKRSEVKASCPVEMVTYNHHAFPCYALVIRGFSVHVAWGHKVFGEEDLHVPEEQITRAVKWCKDHGISFGNPSLMLVGYYG